MGISVTFSTGAGVLATSFVDRHRDGGLETVAIVAAQCGKPAIIVPVHPDGEQIVRLTGHDPSDADLAGGTDYVRWFAASFGGGTLSYATRPAFYDGLQSVPVLRRSRSGVAFDGRERAELVERIRYERSRGRAGEAALVDEYFSRLPLVALARCPFSGRVLFWPFDPFGTDGPPEPSRRSDWCQPLPEPAPPTFLGIRFAVGGTPAISADLLAHPNVRAVVRRLPVAMAEVQLIAYFGVGLTNSDSWTTQGSDTDLTRWVAAGKIGWVSENDPALTIRYGLAGSLVASGQERSAARRRHPSRHRRSHPVRTFERRSAAREVETP